MFSCDTNVPTKNNNPLVGSWHCTETTIYGSRSYLTNIYPVKSDTTQYLLSNFYNISLDDIADIRAKLNAKTFTINPNQSILNSNTTYVVKSGTGVVSVGFGRIDFDYIIYNGSSDINVHAIYLK
jgi:hypothetical protein